MRLDLVMSGLGGQGILFAARLLSQMALQRGWAVIGAETHGMAQRGGSVVAHLRFGGAEGSVIPAGRADALIALQETEAYRNLAFVRPGGVVFVNAERFPWPEVSDYVRRTRITGLAVPADSIALSEGLPRAGNLILIGLACQSERLPFGLKELTKAVREVSPPRFLEANLKAISLGASRA